VEKDDALSIFVFGEKIDTLTCDSYRMRIEPCFEDKKIKTVVLDVSRVRMCDSYGLRLFINLQRVAGQTNRKLILYRPDEILSDLLESTLLTKVFTIVNTEEQLNQIVQ
jgi:anti-anti-sigma factor